MQYWRKTDFISLKEVIEISKGYPHWLGYTQYCVAKEKGLRKQAMQIMEEFIRSMNQKPIRVRIDFTHWIEEMQFKYNDSVGLIPYPLHEEIIAPTLEAWKKKEPQDPVPYRWINTEESLLKAIELDPNEQISKYRLFQKIIFEVWQNQHELEDQLYIGDSKKDRRRLQVLKEKIRGIQEADSEALFEEIEARITICNTYLEFEKSEHFGRGNFISFIKTKNPNFKIEVYL